MFHSVRNKSPIILRKTFNALLATTNSPKYSSNATVELKPFKLFNLENGPSTSASIKKADAETYYRQMYAIRALENIASTMYKEKLIRGFCHLYNGQEACCVGARAVMREADEIITSYRCHAWAYVMGISAHGILAELTGRETGCTRSKGGSMHVYSKHFYGGNGIVGAQVPLGTGIALSNKYRKTGGASLTLYGDGAANQGQVAESFNMAVLWNLPVIYICENNRYGMGTSAKRAAANPDYYTRGDCIPGIWVDGMNVLAVRNAVAFALEYVKSNGPILIEMFTYRYHGHSMSDPGTSYRTRDEVKEIREKQDPIINFKNICLSNKLLSEDEIKKIEESAKKEIDEAAKKARTDKYIGLEELTFDIYAKNYHPYIRGPAGQRLKHEVKGPCINLK